MPIPTYKELMLPILKLIKNGNEYSIKQVIDILTKKYHLTSEERNRLLPSGRFTYFYNRIGWAVTYMRKAGLLESTGRGVFKITKRGLITLEENFSQLDNEYLKRSSEFVKFKRNKNNKNTKHR